MYFVGVILLLLIFPVASVITEVTLYRHTVNILFLAGRWFVFWAVGVRLFIAGARQVTQPQFTAEEIFGIHDPGSFAIVREVGLPTCPWGSWEYAVYFAAAGSFPLRSLADYITGSPEWATSSKRKKPRRSTWR